MTAVRKLSAVKALIIFGSGRHPLQRQITGACGENLPYRLRPGGRAGNDARDRAPMTGWMTV